MWGNRLGWTISAGLAVLFAGGLAAVQFLGSSPSSMTPAFAADPANLDGLILSIEPQSIVAGDEDADAGDDYEQAIAFYNTHPGFFSPSSTKPAAQMDVFNPILAAAHCRSCTLFAKDPQEVVNLDRDKLPIDALLQIGAKLATIALAESSRDDFKNATLHAQAVFVLGEDLFKERLVYEEFEAGISLMGQADYVLIIIAQKQGDANRADKISVFDHVRKDLIVHGSRLDQLHAITKNISGEVSGEHAGDVFVLAKKSHERMWRVEACFQLGRMRYNIGEAGHPADQRYAMALLRKLADSDPDPIVKLAATEARDMSPQDYQRE